MPVCPNCHHKEMVGALFCSECGAQLVDSSSLTTQSMQTDSIGAIPPGVDPNFRPTPPPALDVWISLHLLESGQILPLSDRNEFTLGRISDGQPIMPDVDLSPYQAYANGVSRLHAVLKRSGKRISVMDLGSANGTYLNGKRLSPHVETVIQHGDVIALGKLKIQVLLNI
jgi:hypothetical protein